MKARLSNRQIFNYSLTDTAVLLPETKQDGSVKETTRTVKSKVMILKDRKKTFLEKPDIRVKNFKALIPRLPEPGEDFHIIGGGNIDSFHIIPVTLDLIGQPIESLRVATWSMTQENAEHLLKVFDSGKTKVMDILISIFFQSRYRNTCAFLKEEMRRRNQNLVIGSNHAKVILIDTGSSFYVFQGSANLTGNPRIEQAVFSNSKDIYDFHFSWMSDIIAQDRKVKESRK